MNNSTMSRSRAEPINDLGNKSFSNTNNKMDEMREKMNRTVMY
jgi:hypothetical protein